MPVQVKYILAVLGLTATCIAVPVLLDARQKSAVEALHARVHQPWSTETKNSVIERLGEPDAVRPTPSSDAPSRGDGCSLYFYYRPLVRILDDEYAVCFDKSGKAVSVAYLLSQ